MSSDKATTVDEMAARLGLSLDAFLAMLMIRGWVMRCDDDLWRVSYYAIENKYMAPGVVSQLTPEKAEEIADAYCEWLRGGVN